MMTSMKLDGPAETALHKLQDTQLSPMEEVLFQAWTKANQIKKPDNADDSIDYRGVYKSTGGKVLPMGKLKQITERVRNEQTLLRVLHDRMQEGKEEGESQADKSRQLADKMKQQEQSAVLETEKSKQKLIQSKAAEPGPNALKSQALDNDAKKLDIEKLLVDRSLPYQKKPAQPTANKTKTKVK